ncbi:ninja-family protein AFP3-like [Gastrolobium bilobum]|uniref:ninja-family protein AFP3-like n=1 Tax=Gastrolobium bilobum TaxID=150636 RepID=UPI002AB16C3C|nr:ninja-family protein AFP3-like [Gastrolobium bilobum]
MKFAESVAGKCPLVSTQMLALMAASAVKTPALACANDKLKAHGDSQLEETFTGGSYNIPYMVPRCLAEGGVGSNMQTSTMEENDSMVSRKTMAKDIQHENPPKKLKLGNYCSLKGDVMEILRQMLSVSTTGDGPNGKRIEGFLYKYRSGQVCIVCVCHGSFLTPAEFVMHAGGKEVVNPMKHITVYSNNSF